MGKFEEEVSKKPEVGGVGLDLIDRRERLWKLQFKGKKKKIYFFHEYLALKIF